MSDTTDIINMHVEQVGVEPLDGVTHMLLIGWLEETNSKVAAYADIGMLGVVTEHIALHDEQLVVQIQRKQLAGFTD